MTENTSANSTVISSKGSVMKLSDIRGLLSPNATTFKFAGEGEFNSPREVSFENVADDAINTVVTHDGHGNVDISLIDPSLGGRAHIILVGFNNDKPRKIDTFVSILPPVTQGLELSVEAGKTQYGILVADTFDSFAMYPDSSPVTTANGVFTIGNGAVLYSPNAGYVTEPGRSGDVVTLFGEKDGNLIVANLVVIVKPAS